MGVKYLGNGIHSGYIGETKDNLRHGLGRQYQTDGLYYEGQFENDYYNGYGFGEEPTGSGIVKCGYWKNGQLERELPLNHPDILRVRKSVDKILESYKNRKREKSYVEELWNADPNCKHEIIGARGGGVKCTKCPGWFCF